MNSVRWYVCAHGLLSLLALLPLWAGAQATVEVEKAFQSGVAHEIAVHFGSTVDMKLLEEQNVYGRAQAEVLLDVFLKKNPPRSFAILHRGTSGTNAFFVGRLMSTKENFRVNVFLRERGEGFMVTQIQILRESSM